MTDSGAILAAIYLFLAVAFGVGGVASTFDQVAPHMDGRSAQGQPKPRVESTPWEQLPAYTFPRIGRNTLTSPNGRYVLENVDGRPPAPGDPELRDWHKIYLIDTKRHTSELLYQYGRCVNVLWSPSSEAIAVNDFYASDDSISMLFVLTPKLERINLGKTFLDAPAPPKDRELVRDGYPVFKFVARWPDSKSLLFEITGYAEADETGFKDPFEFVYVYRIGGSFVRENWRAGPSP